MRALLVVILHLFTREIRYLKQWLSIAETSLEKGKGPAIRKLQFIALIEANLQIGMRIALDSEN